MSLHLSVILFTGGGGVSVRGGLCLGGSLSERSLSCVVSVWGGGLYSGVLCPGGLCPGGVSVQEWLPCPGVCVQRGLCQGGRAGGAHPTGMLPC